MVDLHAPGGPSRHLANNLYCGHNRGGWPHLAVNGLLVVALSLSCCTGCVWYGPSKMTRFWADHNTLNRPALYVEQLSHNAPAREKVETYRWQYGVGPGAPVVQPEAPKLIRVPTGGNRAEESQDREPSASSGKSLLSEPDDSPLPAAPPPAPPAESEISAPMARGTRQATGIQQAGATYAAAGRQPVLPRPQVPRARTAWLFSSGR